MSIICLVRHGDCLDTNNYEEWQNSPRYKENSHDTPLSELGFAEILKHKGHIPAENIINVMFFGHNEILTLAAVYLRKELHKLPKGEFFRPINRVYFGDENGMKNGGISSVYGLMLKFSANEYELFNQ